jgi:chromosome segregation ATPase
MKNGRISIAAAALAAVVLGSCGYKSKIAKQEDEIKNLRAEKASVEGVLAEREATVAEMIKAFDEIEANMTEIREQENILAAAAEAGVPRDRKEEIISGIRTIHGLLIESRAKVEGLDKKLAGSNWQLSVFQKKLDELKVQLDERDAQLATLKEIIAERDKQIAGLFTQVDTLTVSVAVQDAVIQQQDRALHTAYFTTGTYKELRDEGVLTAEGGVLGMGRTHGVSDNFKAAAFEEIDIREMTVIPINAKKADLLSEHPAGSYRFSTSDGFVDALEITDPAEFWKASRYMVIEVKGQQDVLAKAEDGMAKG